MTGEEKMRSIFERGITYEEWIDLIMEKYCPSDYDLPEECCIGKRSCAECWNEALKSDGTNNEIHREKINILNLL